MISPTWIVATGNAGKLREIEALLVGTGIELRAQSELGIAPADETAETFVENALLKARHAAQAAGLPAIADDSGLSVDALGGAPGVRSARFAGAGSTDKDNIEHLLALLEDRPEAERTARFHCVLVVVRFAHDPAPVVACGEWRGEIARRPAGTGGFGYDPVFLVPELGLTAAQLELEVKNQMSHRARALRSLQAALRG